jgi:hypothetical protein
MAAPTPDRKAKRRRRKFPEADLGEPLIIPSVVLLAVWTTAVLRLPELTTRLPSVA